MEMPAINPNVFGQQHRYVYGYHSLFADPQIALAKVSHQLIQQALSITSVFI